MRPFRIAIPQSQLDDLHARLDHVRWPDELPEVGWSQGVPLGYMRELVRYWRHDYDWRAHESRLNLLPQFATVIDGQPIHFVHIRSPKPGALPILMTHGWPGSFVEFLDVLEPLSLEHDLIVPSLPGYGFSGPTTEPGWDVSRIARAWAVLAARLGYRRYGAQGGDWGSMITRELIHIDSRHVVGAHLNMLQTPAPRDFAGLSTQDRTRLDRYRRYRKELSGYFKIQSTRPQTLSYALADSPVGQLAWIVERFKDWTDCTDLPEEAVDRDQMLTNVMIYWLTGTTASAARLYFESPGLRRHDNSSPVPVGVAVFPHDLMLPVRTLAEQELAIVHWSELDRGGHFAAMEQPGLFVADVLKFFSTLS
ncbi:epoxide hydrolase family protein [Nocardia sp. NPDC059240]|uniref:epoxide hydrolase family protein n=1 Tax=Nocardia sp. NPDC059240 TaxID=3346786 RepID=UPI0036AFD221